MDGRVKTAVLGIAAAAGLAGSQAGAQEMYLGQIFMMGSNFCPRGSVAADGQLLAISQFSALFSLYGTVYGGDGRTTFALPDLRGRSPVNAGAGPGLTPVMLGQRGGSDSMTLTAAQMPSHSHGATGTVVVNPAPGNSASPVGQVLSTLPTGQPYGPMPGTTTETLAPGAVSVTVQNTGGSQSFPIQDPYLAVTYCIATVGIFPSRS
ncbi:phage tail protein [Mangrovicoccus ximenensis]|uniref:phage tail protein n=1 Tax=Mangrovicoccus ximenensis TaxID=1911570 RepID=UPI00191C4F1A|nr:tail fiber protein [Mangrovicoccus ximenensis]